MEVLKDSVRRFWISTPRLLEDFWGFSFQEGFCFLFFVLVCFWGFFVPFSQIFFFQAFLGFSIKDFFLAYISNLYFLLHFFSSPGWKAGDHGPWIHLRCSLPVCVA